MNKKEFLAGLMAELKDIPAKEREEALQYYEEYFADAGEENEDIVIRELGSPARIARIIRRDIGMQSDEAQQAYDGLEDEEKHEQLAVWGEVNTDEAKMENDSAGENTAYQDSGAYGENSSQEKGSSQGGTYQDSGTYRSAGAGEASRSAYAYQGNDSSRGGFWDDFTQKAGRFFSGENRGIKIALAVIVLIVLLPFLIELLGVIFGILAGIVSIVAAPFIAGISLIGAMIGLIITTPFLGLAVGGYGVLCMEGTFLIILGFGFALTALGIYILRWFLPAAWKVCMVLIKGLSSWFRGNRNGGSL